MIQTLDSLVKRVEVEEVLMSCEIKEHSLNNDLVASECEEVDERDAILGVEKVDHCHVIPIIIGVMHEK